MCVCVRASGWPIDVWRAEQVPSSNSAHIIIILWNSITIHFFYFVVAVVVALFWFNNVYIYIQNSILCSFYKPLWFHSICLFLSHLHEITRIGCGLLEALRILNYIKCIYTRIYICLCGIYNFFFHLLIFISCNTELITSCLY